MLGVTATIDEMMNMKYGERGQTQDTHISYVRVPGGWLYTYEPFLSGPDVRSVFVPEPKDYVPTKPKL